MFLKNKNKNYKFTYICMYIYILNPNVLEILESTNQMIYKALCKFIFLLV